MPFSRLRHFLTSLTICTIALQPLTCFAQAASSTWDAGFDPERILEDDDIFDVNGMSYDRMVSFLKAKGTLADYQTPDIDGVPKKVPEIVWRVANSYKINPKYLLALIQKEQSLVEDPHPTQAQFDWAAGYAICDNCKKDDPDLLQFKGFASQLEWAAKQHREKYLIQILGNGQTRAGKAVGKAMTIDKTPVTPENNATAMLYSYTPHIHGNLNLWRIWKRWFNLTYPDGTLVQGMPSGATYVIQFGEKRKYASKGVLRSLVDASKIIQTSDSDLIAYPDGPVIQYPKYALLKDPKKQIWLLTGTGRRLIKDQKAFRKFSFNEDEVEDVAAKDLEMYPVEAPLTTQTEYPFGVVFKDPEKKLWYVENHIKHAIPDPLFVKLYFKGRNVQTITAKKLATYELGDPYQLHTGELVRGKKIPSVFVIEHGVKRPIPSAEIFETIGWSWKQVVTIPDILLATYPQGPTVDLNAPKSTTLAQE